jgi:hypothetical protein
MLNLSCLVDMPYYEVQKNEAKYLNNLLPQEATEDKFRGTYIAIFMLWFPANRRLFVDPLLSDDGKKYEYMVVHPDYDPPQRNPVLVLTLGSPAHWTEAGRQDVTSQL